MEEHSDFHGEPDPRGLGFKEEPSSPTSQNNQHASSFFPDEKQGIPTLFTVPKTELAITDLSDPLKHEVMDDSHSNVEEEKSCIAALRASVEIYMEKQRNRERDTGLESSGMEFFFLRQMCSDRLLLLCYLWSILQESTVHFTWWQKYYHTDAHWVTRI